jgi:hypothetical protein
VPALASERIRFRLSAGWGTFETRGAVPPGGPLSGLLGRPGLWKLASAGGRASSRRVFELPASILPRREAHS